MSADDRAHSGARSGTWQCGVCQQAHDGLATVFGPTAPDLWADASPQQRRRGTLTPDQCILRDGPQRHSFIRGHIEISVVDRPGTTFIWSVWTSLSEASVDLATKHWDDPARTSLEPMFGWLCNDLIYEPSTWALPTHVHLRAPGVVPSIELDLSLDHPLAVEQREGISWHRVAEINAQVRG